MKADTLIQGLEQRVNNLISPEKDLFLVEIKVKPTNNIKVFIDGDQGVSIDKLVSFNRRLYKQLEEEALFPGGDFSLEVSSPGLEEPLKMQRQYLKNIGRHVEIITNEDARIEGKLLKADEAGLILEETKGKGKKMETIEHSISFDNIKTTKIQIKF